MGFIGKWPVGSVYIFTIYWASVMRLINIQTIFLSCGFNMSVALPTGGSGEIFVDSVFYFRDDVPYLWLLILGGIIFHSRNEDEICGECLLVISFVNVYIVRLK